MVYAAIFYILFRNPPPFLYAAREISRKCGVMPSVPFSPPLRIQIKNQISVSPQAPSNVNLYLSIFHFKNPPLRSPIFILLPFSMSLCLFTMLNKSHFVISFLLYSFSSSLTFWQSISRRSLRTKS